MDSGLRRNDELTKSSEAQSQRAIRPLAARAELRPGRYFSIL